MDDQEDDTTVNYYQIRKLAAMLAGAGISFFFHEFTNGYGISCYGIQIREMGEANPHIPSDGVGADRLLVSGTSSFGGPESKTIFGDRLVSSDVIFNLLLSLHNQWDVQIAKRKIWGELKPGEFGEWEHYSRFMHMLQNGD
jgi:hypothetical protein